MFYWQHYSLEIFLSYLAENIVDALRCKGLCGKHVRYLNSVWKEMRATNLQEELGISLR